MKRIIFSFVVTFLVLAIALTAIITWRNLGTFPYCEIARNSEQYHRKVVRVRARLILGSEGMYIYEDCDPVSALASMVELKDSNGSNARNFVEEVLVSGDKDQVKKADAVVIGVFDGEYSRGCWGPQFHIVASSIELVSPITNYEPVSSSNELQRTKH